MATKNFPISGATSSSTKDWSYTISKSDINTWIGKNIPANATIKSAVISCNCSKSASTATGTLEITVGGTQVHFAEKKITVSSYNPNQDIASFINSSNQISGDVVLHFFFYNTGSLTGTPKWTVSSGNIIFTYEEHVHTPGSSATCTTAQTCTVCGATITAALGHSYGSPTYTWSADGKTCTAKRVCSNNSSHTETATATITSAVKTAATCAEKGTTRYTATFSVSWASTQTKDVQDIAAKGHTWKNATCTVPKTCSVCGATEGSALGHDYKSVVTAPTVNSAGYTTHTCSRCGDSYKDSYTYLITFKNSDGTTLETVIVGEGETPVYSKTPTKASTAEFEYTFEGWSPEISGATANQVYTPIFTEKVREYYIHFARPENGSIIGATNGYYPYGTELTITAVPDNGYKFVKWDDDYGTTDNPRTITVTDKCAYVAIFEKLTQQVYSGTTLTSPYSGNVKIAVYVGNTKI